MAEVYFISDLHLDHKNICNFRKNFNSVAEHNAIIKDNYHKIIKKQDKVYFLGDVAFSKKALEDVSKWIGTKTLIVGNHDLDRDITMRDLCNSFADVYSFLKYKNFWLSHCPIHPDELRGKINLHGHTHGHLINDERYVNVCLEHTNYSPISLSEIKDRLNLG